MPQLEQVEFFISQLFWLGVFFVILFTVLTYITLPKIRAFLNQRDNFVKSHISKQDELIKKAESIIENYEAKLTEAKNQASQIINDAKDKALKESEASIKCLLSIFDYNFQVAEKRFKKEGVSVYSLSDYEHLIELATENRFILKSEEEMLRKWRLAPEKWKP